MSHPEHRRRDVSVAHARIAPKDRASLDVGSPSQPLETPSGLLVVDSPALRSPGGSRRDSSSRWRPHGVAEQLRKTPSGDLPVAPLRSRVVRRDGQRAIGHPARQTFEQAPSHRLVEDAAGGDIERQHDATGSTIRMLATGPA